MDLTDNSFDMLPEELSVDEDEHSFASNIPTCNASSPKLDTATTKSKSFICDTCGNSYKTLYGLHLHKKGKHLGEYKHICQICKKGFNQSSQFRSHYGVHLKLATHKCAHCDVVLHSAPAVARHMKTCKNVSRELVICKTCGSTFASKALLHDHEKGKHQPPRYKCVHCGNMYSWRSSLRKHKTICEMK